MRVTRYGSELAYSASPMEAAVDSVSLRPRARSKLQLKQFVSITGS